MNKKDLVEAVSDEMDMSRMMAERAVDGVLQVVEKSLSQGEPVRLIGFGQWEVQERGPRKGRNPRTGETVDIPAAKKVRFKPGEALKKAVNGEK